MKELGCDRAYVDEFKENSGSFFGWIYFTITCCFLALLSYFFIPALSIVFIALGLVLCFLQFGLYKKIVDKFFKEETGHNATGFKKPAGEVKRRIIFVGHADACWEWPFKYKFTYLGFDIHMMLCFLGAFYLLAIAILNIAGVLEGALATKLGLGTLAFVPFWFGLYFMWNRNRVVDGANDNLSGCNRHSELGSHDNILIVRENEYSFCRSKLNSAENILCAGIHCLSAANEGINAEVGKELFNSVADTNADKSVFLFGFNRRIVVPARCRNLFGFAFAVVVLHTLVLVAHILDFEINEGTEFESVFDSVAGMIGVNVNLYNVLIVNYYANVTD